MRYLLYLAGPITGLTYAECTDWRDWVRAQLPPDIVGLSPMRGRGVITGPIRRLVGRTDRQGPADEHNAELERRLMALLEE